MRGVPSTINIMFDNPVSASRSRFASSPSDLQPTTDESVEDKNDIRVEKDSSIDSDAYTSNSATDVQGGAVHPVSPDNVPLSEIVSQEFLPFDAETLVVHPIMAEESSDEKFYKELGEHLIESMLIFHAWAAARPRHEHSVICESISSKMTKIEETEKDQGRYHTTLHTENHMPLSSAQHRSPEIEDEPKYPLLDACPHSPPRSAFVCSRSLELNRKRLANFVEQVTNALASLAENSRFN